MSGTAAMACCKCRLAAEADEWAEWEANEAFYYLRRPREVSASALTAHQGKRAGSVACRHRAAREGRGV